MFAQVNPLPGSQAKFTVAHGDGDRTPHQRRFQLDRRRVAANLLADLALLIEEPGNGLSDELVANGGSQHHVLVEQGPGELRACCFDVDGGR